MTHDQNFKNLILDYPREAIALFAASEAQAIDADARVTPVRQGQLQERLGERFRELDVPLLVEWPDGSSSVWISSTSMRRWTRMNASSTAGGVRRRWQRWHGLHNGSWRRAGNRAWNRAWSRV